MLLLFGQLRRVGDSAEVHVDGADLRVLVGPAEPRAATGILRAPDLLAGIARIIASQVIKLAAVDAVLLDVGADVVEEAGDAGEDAGGGPCQDGTGGIALELVHGRSVFVGHVEIAAGGLSNHACERGARPESSCMGHGDHQPRLMLKKTLRLGGNGAMSRLPRMAAEPKFPTSGSRPLYFWKVKRFRPVTLSR